MPYPSWWGKWSKWLSSKWKSLRESRFPIPNNIVSMRRRKKISLVVIERSLPSHFHSLEVEKDFLKIIRSNDNQTTIEWTHSPQEHGRNVHQNNGNCLNYFQQCVCLWYVYILIKNDITDLGLVFLRLTILFPRKEIVKIQLFYCIAQLQTFCFYFLYFNHFPFLSPLMFWLFRPEIFISARLFHSQSFSP